jgi:hypothetical protein
MRRRLVRPVESRVDERGNDHATERSATGEDATRPGRQLSVDHLSLDLETDEKEEGCHQRIIDPILKLRTEFGVKKAEIRRCGRRVGRQDRKRRDGHQKEPRRSLIVEEFAESGLDSAFRQSRRHGFTPLTRLIEVSVNFGNPAAHAAHASANIGG